MMLWFNRHRCLRDQLSAYIDGELDASATERLESHLPGCGRCRQEMEQLRATVVALQELPAVEPPRSFTLSPERVAPRPPMPVASPLAFGARIAAAAVAAALTVVLVVDLGDFGGDGVTDEATAPQMMQSEAAEDELEAEGGVAAPEEAQGAPAAEDAEATFMRDAEAEEAEAPPAAPGEAGQPDEAEAAAVTAAGGEGGIDALSAAEIGLATALMILVVGSLALAFAGRRR